MHCCIECCVVPYSSLFDAAEPWQEPPRERERDNKSVEKAQPGLLGRVLSTHEDQEMEEKEGGSYDMFFQVANEL